MNHAQEQNKGHGKQNTKNTTKDTQYNKNNETHIK